jgi:predicted O-methyltransferase YrrM
MMKKNNPEKVFEIGTFDGRTTLNIAMNSSPQTEIYTLDLPKDMLHSTKFPLAKDDKRYVKKIVSGSRFQGNNYDKKIIQLYGDSGKYDFSPFFKSFGFIFIDGAHSYDYVLNDSAVALKLMLEKQSIIIWHDYGGWIGVTKALNELYLNGDCRFRNLKHIEGTSLVYLLNV